MKSEQDNKESYTLSDEFREVGGWTYNVAPRKI